MCKFKLQKKILGSVFVKICGNEAFFEDLGEGFIEMLIGNQHCLVAKVGKVFLTEGRHQKSTEIYSVDSLRELYIM